LDFWQPEINVNGCFDLDRLSVQQHWVEFPLGEVVIHVSPFLRASWPDTFQPFNAFENRFIAFFGTLADS